MTDSRPRRTLRVLHISDLHLDHTFRDISLSTVRDILTGAKIAHVDAIIIAGDLFDSARQPMTFVSDMADALGHADVSIIAVPGNHDIVYNGSRDPAIELFNLLDDRHTCITSGAGEAVVRVGGSLRVWGKRLREHSPESRPLGGLGKMDSDDVWNVVLAHGDIVPAYGATGSPIVLEEYKEELATVHYLGLGHWHRPASLLHGSTIVCYSGSASHLVGTGTGVVVDFDTESGVTAKTVKLDQLTT